MGIALSQSMAKRSGGRPVPARRRIAALRFAGICLAAQLCAGCSILPFGKGPADDPAAEGQAVDGKGAESSAAPSNDLQRGLAELHARQAADPANVEWPCRIAAMYAAADSATQAEAAWRSALAIDPSYGPALSQLSRQLFTQARHQEAVDLIEAARARGAVDSPELRAGLALQYEALGDHERARELISGLSAPGAHWKTAGSALTYVALHGEDMAAAVDPARQALSADPDLAANHNNYGIMQLYAGDPKGARESFLKALDLDPRLPGAYYNLAIVDRFYFFDDEAARGWFDRYWALSHDDPDNLRAALHAPDEGRPVALEGK